MTTATVLQPGGQPEQNNTRTRRRGCQTSRATSPARLSGARAAVSSPIPR